jgi:probable addiction module antidote protein
MAITKKEKRNHKYSPTASWEETIIPLLQNDPAFAAEFLLDALREESPDVFLSALHDVITAFGGFSAFARLTGMNRTNLHRTLSKGGNPTWSNLQPILQSLGIELLLNPKKSKFLKSFPSKKGTFAETSSDAIESTRRQNGISPKPLRSISRKKVL